MLLLCVCSVLFDMSSVLWLCVCLSFVSVALVCCPCVFVLLLSGSFVVSASVCSLLCFALDCSVFCFVKRVFLFLCVVYDYYVCVCFVCVLA